MARNFIVMYKMNTHGISWFEEITGLMTDHSSLFYANLTWCLPTILRVQGNI